MSPELFFDVFAGFAFLVFWLVAFVILYHLTRFGIGVLSKRLSVLFLFGSLVLSSIALVFYLKVDISVLAKMIQSQ